MAFHLYRLSKKKLSLLIGVTIGLTWSLILYANTADPILFYHQLPWYRHNHTPITTNGTSYTWTTNNQSLDNLLQYAETEMRRTLLQNYEEHIPGSALTTLDQVTQFRSKVACWTGQGTWQHQPTLQPLPHYQDPLYGKCDRQSKGIQRQATQYHWQPPSHCPLLANQINQEEWCSILNGRHTLIVGDLIQYQLHDLLLDALRSGPTSCYGELNCKDHTVCPRPNKARLRYVRNDLLSNTRRVDLAHGEPRTDKMEWPFLGARPLESYKVILLNRSPVVDDDWAFVQHLVTSLTEIRKFQPEALILYRSSFVGHPYCDDAQGPITSSHPHWQSQLPYGWSEYGRRNRLAQVLVELAGGVYLDMATSLDRRPDGHVGGSDCLRYCMPGPLDSWALLLYNVFMALGPPL